MNKCQINQKHFYISAIYICGFILANSNFYS